MILAALALAAPAPSFDCAKATTKVEKMICGDERLRHLDQAVAVLYRAALRRKPKSENLAHRQWLIHRDVCRDRGCLISEYEGRIADLLDPTGGLGTPYLSKSTNGNLTVFDAGDGWYAFRANGIYKMQNDPSDVRISAAAGVFKLVSGTGGWPATKEDCGYRVWRLPGDRWRLEEVAPAGELAETYCGGWNSTISGTYKRSR